MARQSNTADGEFFGPFEVHEQLGFGGMATVHRATKRCPDGTTQSIALKRILPHLAEDERFVANFKREAHLGLLLNHAGIVTVYERGQVGLEHYIAMEYIDGWNLRQILRCAVENGCQPPIAVVLGILSLLSRALVYAHERHDDDGLPLGLVHRDISPANVLVSRTGVLKIIDFGIAHASSNQPLTQSGTFKGKLGYMSPEALQSREVDARSDIWSLGVVAHELVTARSLFDRPNEFETIQRVRDLEIPSPCMENADCPLALAAIILRALERDADQRWQSARQMATALDELACELELHFDDDAIALWCSQATGEIEPLIEEDHAATLVSIRAPSANETGESYRVNSASLPLPLPLPPPPAVPARLPMAAAGASENVNAAAAATPRITYRSATITESTGQIQPVAVPPAGLSYLHSNRAHTRGLPAPHRRPGSWAMGTVSPPALTTPAPVAARPISAHRPMPGPLQSLSLARRQSRGYQILLALTLCSAAAVSLAIIDKLSSKETGPGKQVPQIPSVDLEPSQVVLETTPSDATVYVDGAERISPLSLLPGNYDLELRAAGHVSFREVLVVEPGVDRQFRVALTAIARPPVRKAPTSSPSSSVATNPLNKRKGATLVLAASAMGKRDRVRALVCVTPTGQVGSANILSDLPSPTRRHLEQQLSTWLYEPLSQDGVNVAACFTSSMHIKAE